MDVLIGDGEIVTVKPGDDLFDAFANSYGSLGYATRLRIELEPVPPYVAAPPRPLRRPRRAVRRRRGHRRDRQHEGARVDGLDGVVFAPGERLPDAGTGSPTGPARPATTRVPSPTTGPSTGSGRRSGGGTDRLTMYDYLWRWDTDWFWCSGAFGLHDPRVRRLWPRRWRRSDVYHRLVGLENRYGTSRPGSTAGAVCPSGSG